MQQAAEAQVLLYELRPLLSAAQRRNATLEAMLSLPLMREIAVRFVSWGRCRILKMQKAP